MSPSTFLEIARIVARESKCVSLHVGAVLVKDGRIIATGYNGTPSGFTNCRDKFPDFKPGRQVGEKSDRELHHEWSLQHEIHAEMNALLFAAKHGIATEGAEIYITHQPCDQCVKNMIQSGLIRIVYETDYRIPLTCSSYEMLGSSRVELWKFKNGDLEPIVT